MRVILTGGFGYVGSRLAQHLSSAGYEITLGSRQRTLPPAWCPLARTAQLDWDDQAQLEEACAGHDAILHLAGLNAQDCAADPEAALQVNGVHTARLVKAAISQGVRRFVHFSTAHVYASPLAGTITEATCPRSQHPYATSHRAGEDVVRWVHGNNKIEGIVIRLSNAFGAPADIAANCWMLFVNDLCRQATTTGRMILKSGGQQRRDFIPLTDACAAVQHLLEMQAHKPSDGLFNVGGDWSPTLLEMAERIAARFHVMTGQRPTVIIGEESADHVPQSPLVYETANLRATGFAGSRKEHIDMEIDRLIHFCEEAWGAPP